jgi:hypothetical protein
MHVHHRRRRRRCAAPGPRVNFAVVAKAPIGRFRDHARRRGWRHVLLLSLRATPSSTTTRRKLPKGSSFPSPRCSSAAAARSTTRGAVSSGGRLGSGTKHKARGFHVADGEHLGHHARRPRRELEPQPQVPVALRQGRGPQLALTSATSLGRGSPRASLRGGSTEWATARRLSASSAGPGCTAGSRRRSG